MFDSLEELDRKLAATGYFIDPVMVQVVYLAAKLQKPLLLEGPAGSGKTQLALSVAAAARTHVERLQCYRGVTEDKAIGRFDEGLQRLYMEFSKGQHENWQTVQANLKGRDFFRPGPLMRALECDRPCVLLIDELDKVDEGFEAMLLEILSAWTLSIPEFGTVSAKSIPFVVLTSNEERRLGDPIRRRSLYVRIEHPTPEREAEIIASRTPKADEKFHREMAGIALSFRNYSLEKPPSVSEMIDFANALQLLGTDHVCSLVRSAHDGSVEQPLALLQRREAEGRSQAGAGHEPADRAYGHLSGIGVHGATEHCSARRVLGSSRVADSRECRCPTLPDRAQTQRQRLGHQPDTGRFCRHA